MTEEEYFRKNYPDSCYGDKPLSPHWDFFQDGVEFGERQSEKKIEELEAQLEQEKNLSQCRLDHNEQLRETVKKARSIVHRLLVLIQEHKWWNYTVIDEARAFMSEVDRDKDND